MKNIFESAEVMAAYAEIDLDYIRVRQLNEMLVNEKPLTTIEMMVGEATGYDMARLSSIKKQLVDAMSNIIDNKKIIEADTAFDEKILEQLKKML